MRLPDCTCSTSPDTRGAAFGAVSSSKSSCCRSVSSSDTSIVKFKMSKSFSTFLDTSFSLFFSGSFLAVGTTCWQMKKLIRPLLAFSTCLHFCASDLDKIEIKMFYEHLNCTNLLVVPLPVALVAENRVRRDLLAVWLRAWNRISIALKSLNYPKSSSQGRSNRM